MILKVYKVWTVIDSGNYLKAPGFLKCFIIKLKSKYSNNNLIL